MNQTRQGTACNKIGIAGIHFATFNLCNATNAFVCAWAKIGAREGSNLLVDMSTVKKSPCQTFVCYGTALKLSGSISAMLHRKCGYKLYMVMYIYIYRSRKLNMTGRRQGH